MRSEYLDPDDRNSDFIVGSGYTKEKLLQMVTIRYAMSLNSYQKYIATTVAKDVSDETVAMIMENADVLDGVSVTEDTIRKYVDSIIPISSVISERFPMMNMHSFPKKMKSIP